MADVGARADATGSTGSTGELAALQAALSQRLGVLSLLPESDPGYPAACDEVFAAGVALVAAEERVPAELAEAAHLLSRRVLLGGGGFTGLVGVGIGVAAGLGALAAWWWVAAVAALAAGLLVVRTPLPPPTGPHRRQRPGAVELALAAALLGGLAVASGRSSGPSWPAIGWLLAAVLGLAGLGLATLRTSIQAHGPVRGMGL